MIYTSAALAYLHERHCDTPDIALTRGDIMWLKVRGGLAEVWRDAELAYRDTARDYGTAEGICAVIAELGREVRGTAAHLLAGDILKDVAIPEDLPADGADVLRALGVLS